MFGKSFQVGDLQTTENKDKKNHIGDIFSQHLSNARPRAQCFIDFISFQLHSCDRRRLNAILMRKLGLIGTK